MVFVEFIACLFLAAVSADAGLLAPAPLFAPAPLLAKSLLPAPLLASPAFAPAPLLARATLPFVPQVPVVSPYSVGYAHGIPQNIPPFASQVSIVNRALSSYITAPLPAPFVAPYLSSPALLRSALPYAAAPVLPSLPYLRSPIAPFAYPSTFALNAAPLAAGPLPVAAAPLPLAAAPLPLAAAGPAVFPVGPVAGPALETRAIFPTANVPADVPTEVSQEDSSDAVIIGRTPNSDETEGDSTEVSPSADEGNDAASIGDSEETSGQQTN